MLQLEKPEVGESLWGWATIHPWGICTLCRKREQTRPSLGEWLQLCCKLAERKWHLPKPRMQSLITPTLVILHPRGTSWTARKNWSISLQGSSAALGQHFCSLQLLWSGLWPSHLPSNVLWLTAGNLDEFSNFVSALPSVQKMLFFS